MFLWIVAVINTSLGKGEESLPFIGVLDIFGEGDIESVASVHVDRKVLGGAGAGCPSGHVMSLPPVLGGPQKITR